MPSFTFNTGCTCRMQRSLSVGDPSTRWQWITIRIEPTAILLKSPYASDRYSVSKTDILSPMVVLALLLAGASTASAGAVYTCTNPDGQRVFQQVPCSIDSLGSLADAPASATSQRQEAVLQAAAADYARRIKEVELLMENDMKLNEALEQKK
ncbi:MAG: hypothetical protein JWP80_119 [Pseudomonas sp.]|nr:hypothetical protein [Pseudomonas sp.]